MSKRVIERRIVDAKIEVRTNGDGSTGVRGYAAVFDSPAHGEVVTRAAFNRTIAQRDNIRFLINHEGTPLASTRAGTMTVGVDDHGLWFDIPSLDMANPRAQEFASATARGDLHQCSFAGYFRDRQNVDGVSELREVELIDVSGVTFPWYDDTAMVLTGDRKTDKALIGARSVDADDRARLIADAMRAAPPGGESYGEIACALCKAISATLPGVPYLYLDDLGSDWAVYSLWDGEDWDYYQLTYTANDDGTFTLGAPFEVEVVTEYRPTTAAEIAAEDGPVRSFTVAEARALLGLTIAA